MFSSCTWSIHAQTPIVKKSYISNNCIILWECILKPEQLFQKEEKIIINKNEKETHSLLNFCFVPLSAIFIRSWLLLQREAKKGQNCFLWKCTFSPLYLLLCHKLVKKRQTSRPWVSPIFGQFWPGYILIAQAVLHQYSDAL